MYSVIDFHTHILPGIDDGSSSIEESIKMLKSEMEQGISHVVATPHFYANSDNPTHFLKKRNEAYSKLTTQIAQYPGLPKISLGAEVYYFHGISEWEGLRDMVIEGTNTVLIEMPSAPWSNIIYRELNSIFEKQGIVPIIAHIDRYISPFKTYGIPKTLAQMPVFIQANSNFFVDSLSAALAFKMLKNGQIHILGSDCHNTVSRIPDLRFALNKISNKLGNEAIHRINLLENEIFQVK